MKLKVTKSFIDKHDHVTVYSADTIIEVEDEARAQSLLDRELCAIYGGKKAASVTLSEPAPDAEVKADEEGSEESDTSDE